jgi:hypothetical protein
MNNNFLPPLPPNPKGQAKLILKSAGLTFLKPMFFNVDVDTISTEQSAQEAALIDNQNHETLSDSRSKFGLPVFDTVLFEQVQYTTNEGNNVIVKPFSMGTVLCEVSQSRNIVATSIAGRNGTVKEYISDGDYNINIKGVLASLYQNVAPKDSINQLMGFCNAPVQFNVSSNFLAYFGVLSIVIKDYNFSQMEGQRNVIAFELTCLSDTPFEIKGTQNKSVPSFY